MRLNKFPQGAAKIIITVFFVLILTMPLSGVDSSEEDIRNGIDEKTEDDNQIPNDSIQSDITRDMGLDDDLTRSPPWKEWERFHYHRGGESGAATYNSTSNKVYLYGGGSESYRQGRWSYSAEDDMFAYDLDADRWIAIEKATSPGARFRMSYATDEQNGIMYILGGYQGTSSGILVNDLWSFDMGTETWNRVVSSGPLPSNQRRAQAPMVFDPDYGTEGALYIHMGRDDNRDNLTRFYRIDLSNPSATPFGMQDGQSDGLVPRWGHDMVLDEGNDRAYIFGGVHKDDQGDEEYLREMWYTDISVSPNIWTQIVLPEEMPTLIGARMFMNENGTINIWGGRRNESSDWENETLWIYDPQTESWSWQHYANDNDERPNDRGYYARYYSEEDDRFFSFAGQYWYRYGGSIRSSNLRDLNYLNTRFTLDWTQFPNNQSTGTTSNGILCHDSDRDRLYYVGPTSANNGTEYVYYWDLNINDWIGPFYSQESGNPPYRTNAGLCYVEEENTVYMYGGGYTTGWGNNREYYTLSDMWKLDLDTYQWSNIYEEAFPGQRQGMELIYNPDNGLIYFYGGYEYLDPTDSTTMKIHNDFWTFNPTSNTFLKKTSSGSSPEARYGSALCYIPEDNVIFLFGGNYLSSGSSNPREENDMWKFFISNGTWKEMDAAYKPSDRSGAKMVYDPLTKEIFLSGGSSNDDLIRYRILENRWYSDYYFVPNPGMIESHAMLFTEESRDIWLIGGGAKAGMWKLGIPPRLGIQDIRFTDPDEGTDMAFAMMRPYNFRITVKTVNGPQDLDEMSVKIRHRFGTYELVYDRDEDIAGNNAWTEKDSKDYAELGSEPTVTEEGNLISVNIPIMFHWNWTQYSSPRDRWVEVSCTGHDVEPDQLQRYGFLRVRNRLELVGNLLVDAQTQGRITNNSWVRSNEEITVHGPFVEYAGTDVNPPENTYTVALWDEDENMYASSSGSGEEINITFNTPNTTYNNYVYVINISDVPSSTDTSELELTLNIDGDDPNPPGQVLIHADDFEDTRTNYDDEREVFLTWQSAKEFSSGIYTYYYSFEDNSGTRDGFEVSGNLSARVELPKPGNNTIFVWAEDNVGNIGPAANSTILIDEEQVVFELLSPDLNETIPYTDIDLKVNITDNGGSRIDPKMIQYRYTTMGLNHQEMWQSDTAWKHITKLWDLGVRDNFLFDLQLKSLSDSADNYVQFRAKDGASSSYFTSEIYNLMVDTDLAYPNVTIVSPPDKAEFEDAANVVLSWDVNFFAPEDVEYYLYMSNDKQMVADKDDQALWIDQTISATDYRPTGLEFGIYYWTVIPVAKGEYVGECLDGIYSFDLTNEANYAFTVNSDRLQMKFRQGMRDIPLKFRIINQASTNGFFTPDVDGLDGMNITWDVLPPTGYKVEVNSEYEATAYLNVPEDMELGNYTVEIEFTNQWGVNRSVNLDIQITPKEADDNGEDGEDGISVTAIIIIVVVTVVLILVVGSILYFFVYKSSEDEEVKTKGMEESLEDIEREYGVSSGAATAPQPTGSGHTGAPSAPVTSGDVQQPPTEGSEQEEAEGPISLAEEGSEDDWMNLVARETKDLESQSEIEEDKAIQSDGKPKSLSDILAEMEGNSDD